MDSHIVVMFSCDTNVMIFVCEKMTETQAIIEVLKSVHLNYPAKLIER